MIGVWMMMMLFATSVFIVQAIDPNIEKALFDDFKVPHDRRKELGSIARNISSVITKRHPQLTRDGHLDKFAGNTRAAKCLGMFAAHHVSSNSKHVMASNVSKHIRSVYDTACGDTFERMSHITGGTGHHDRHMLGFFDWSTAILETTSGVLTVSMGVIVGVGLSPGVGIAMGGLGLAITSDGINRIINVASGHTRLLLAGSVPADVIDAQKLAIDGIIRDVTQLFV